MYKHEMKYILLAGSSKNLSKNVTVFKVILLIYAILYNILTTVLAFVTTNPRPVHGLKKKEGCSSPYTLLACMGTEPARSKPIDQLPDTNY